MKKILTALLSVVILCSISIKVSAAESSDNFSDLSEEIIATVNGIFSDKLPRQITQEDIDYNSVYKIYTETNVFELNTSNMDEIINISENEGYIYELPVYIEDDTVIVVITKGRELNESVEFTEEERQQILANVGKWGVAGVKYFEDETIDHVQEIQKSTNYISENVILVGGLPCFRYAVALIADDNRNIQEIVPLSSVPGIENIRNARMHADIVYDYQQVKEYINQIPKSDPDLMGGYGFPDLEKKSYGFSFFIGVSAAICMVAAVGIFMYIKKRKSHGEGRQA